MTKLSTSLLPRGTRHTDLINSTIIIIQLRNKSFKRGGPLSIPLPLATAPLRVTISSEGGRELFWNTLGNHITPKRESLYPLFPVVKLADKGYVIRNSGLADAIVPQPDARLNVTRLIGNCRLDHASLDLDLARTAVRSITARCLSLIIHCNGIKSIEIKSRKKLVAIKNTSIKVVFASSN